ncbi:Protein-tyrosine phosphatase, partial [Cooperia oncophora]
YDDVICIDATRVILKGRPPDDDYIHANWMVMPDSQKYICTQNYDADSSHLAQEEHINLKRHCNAILFSPFTKGPIQETILDFWHMIFTEKGTVIVMLCAFKEGNNEKCALYHPKNKNECGKVSLDVHHLACTEWPDHTAPFEPGPIVGMMRLARELAKGNPIIVHCSAGIGRSATFVGTAYDKKKSARGIDYAMQKIKEDSNTSMVDVMKDLRNQRFQSIQGIIQYIFLHMCVLEGFA